VHAINDLLQIASGNCWIGSSWHTQGAGRGEKLAAEMQATKKAGARPAFSSMWLTPKSVPDLST
jgi:hypothetical protein